MKTPEPKVWVALNNYRTPCEALGNDRFLNDELGNPNNYEKIRGPLELGHYLNENVNGDFGFKINGDLVTEANLDKLASKFKELDKPLFFDLKLWKGGGTMSRIVESLSNKDVEYTNAYAHADDLLQRSTDKDTKILGLTVLTHYPDEYYPKMHNSNKLSVIESLSENAYEHGCYGLILPPTALGIFDSNNEKLGQIGEEMYKVTPSIRPEWDERSASRNTKAGKKDKQSQKATPKEAFERGADALVVGSPVYRSRKHSLDSRSPPEALKSILEEIDDFI